MTAIDLSMLVTDLPLPITSVVKAPFFLHSYLQIPQSDFCTIPAACFVENCPQVILDYVLG